MLAARITALFLLGLTLSRAGDIKLTDGTLFKNATVVSHDDKSAMISFSGGVAKVKIELVPPLLLEQPVLAGIPGATPDPAIVAAKEKEDIAKVKKAVDAGVMKVDGTVVTKNDKGIAAYLSVMESHVQEIPHREIKTLDVVPKGLGHTPVNQTEIDSWTTTEMVTSRKQLGLSFVACNSQDIDPTDSTPWTGNVWHVGHKVYVDDEHVSHTLEQYTTIPDEAYKYYVAHPSEIPKPQAPLQPDRVISQSPVTANKSFTTPPSMNP